MEQHDYRKLIKSLEIDATVNPAIFRTKVFAVSSAAYVVLFGTLVLTALFIYWGFNYSLARRQGFHAAGFVFLALMALPAFFVVLRFFFMRIPQPEGRVLTRTDAPKLFSILDKMRKQLKGPPIHCVLVDDDFNASIRQRPRWGLFGGHTNYLTLGLPYMLSMTPKEMLATVAHEYGHVCGNHGKLSAWIYRQRLTFIQLYDRISHDTDENWINSLLTSMLEKYMPYYTAHTFVLSRQNEYEADQTATQLAGAKANASGLIRGELLAGWFHEEFWPKLYRQANSNAAPQFMPYTAMRTAFKASYSQWATKENLALAWAEKSDLHDTHPALRDRVEAIGEEAILPACVEVTAAEALFGENTKSLIQEFDQRWWSNEKKGWTERFKYVTRSKAALEQFRKQDIAALKLADLQEYAMLSAEFEPAAAAKLVLEQLMRQTGGPFPRAEYEYGLILLNENNDSGVDHLATAAKSDYQLMESATRYGYFYLHKKYGEHRAQRWWESVIPQDED